VLLTCGSVGAHKPKRQRDFHVGLTMLQDKPAAGSSSAAAGALHVTRAGSPTAAALRSLSPTGSKHSRSRSLTSTLQHTAGGSDSRRPATVAVSSGREGRVWAPHGAVLSDTGLSTSREVVLRFRAQAGESYMLVPYTR
jgi:hypothetical protein